jgi:hypothetical protein
MTTSTNDKNLMKTNNNVNKQKNLWLRLENNSEQHLTMTTNNDYLEWRLATSTNDDNYRRWLTTTVNVND